MNDNKNKHLTDSDVSLFFDGAERLLRKAENDAVTTQKVIKELSGLTKQLDKYSNEIHHRVLIEIHNAAENTAINTAKLLSEQFRLSDHAAQRYQEAAENAAQKYNEAATIHSRVHKKRIFRDLPVFLAAQLVFLIIIAIILSMTIPSLDEIQQRRHELSDLNTQIKNNKIEWSKCNTGGEVVKCIRTDEVNYSLYTDKTGVTYRVPWHPK